MRILVVDDQASIRDLLADELNSLGYEVFLAGDGLEGLKLVEQVRPNILILDVTMPGLDGFELLGRLRIRERVPHLYVLMLTARAKLEEVERGLESGADDYISKPFELRELVARVHAAERIQTLQGQLLLKNRELNETNQALETSLKKQELLNRKFLQEMEIAARLQTSLLSPVRMELSRFHLLARYRPSASIGGDFYDLRSIGSNRANIFLADAVGHGVSAALLAAMLQVALEEALSEQTIPSKILTELNRSFQFCADRGKYLTAFSGVLDCDTGELMYSLAGHVPPLLYRSSNRTVEKLESPGYCVGIFEEGQYEDRKTRIIPGDRLFVFTDGIYEATPDDQTIFGHGIPALLHEYAHLPNEEFLDRLESGLSSFLGSTTATDDYTLLSVRAEPA